MIPISPDKYAWIQWRSDWQADRPGDYTLACRATDEAGNIQPLDPNVRWSRQGMGGNGVQKIAVTVRAGVGIAGTRVPSPTQALVAGAEVPPPT